MNTNIRFVRCPKCRLVLPEPAESPVYQCGGCGALLQAKNRKTDANDGATSNIVQTGSAPKPTPEHTSEVVVSTNLNQQSTIVSSEQAEKDQYDPTDSLTEKPSCINHSEEARSSTDISSHENPESSPEARALIDSDTETCHPDQNDGSDSDKEQHVRINMSGGTHFSPSPELNYHPNSESSSIQIEVDEENVVDHVDEENVGPSHINKFQGIVDTGSAKTFEGTSFYKPRRDLGVSIGGMPKSPIRRSYNAYGSSVSSFDGNHDQITDTHLIPRRSNYGVRPKELPRGDVGRGKLGRSENEMNRGQWPHEFTGPTRQALKGDDARYRAPFYERSSRASHGDASTSTLGFSEFHYNSPYHSPVKSNDPESEKRELLRMVHQLQDQLDRAHLMTGEREMHQDLNYSRYPVQYGNGKSWSHQIKPSRTAFSGETLHNRGQIECTCFHCYPQNRHYSAQLPLRDTYGIKEQYGTHYSPYQSGPTSPLHHNGSEYSLWSHETRSNDQWHRKERDMKTRQPPKRHFRPLAGGSPMVACYICSETLQLPADFLVFRRRYHRLKCSSCSKVLKFSLLNRNRLVRYVPESETMAPPPSEVDEYTVPNKARIFKSESVSYSDDYGGVYSKDYSAETDPLSIPAPFGRKMTSASSSDPTVERKKKSVQSSGPGKISSKKISSEIEENPVRSGSPLHRLMGYASPSRVLRGEAD